MNAIDPWSRHAVRGGFAPDWTAPLAHEIVGRWWKGTVDTCVHLREAETGASITVYRDQVLCAGCYATELAADFLVPAASRLAGVTCARCESPATLTWAPMRALGAPIAVVTLFLAVCAAHGPSGQGAR